MSVLLYYIVTIVSAVVLRFNIANPWLLLSLVLLVSIGWSFVFSVIWFPNAIDWNSWLWAPPSKYDDQL